MKVLGADPGQKGALAILDTETGAVAVTDMPLTPYGKKKLVSGLGLARILEDWQPDVAFVEKVGARPGQGSVSMFNFGASYWGLKSVCECFVPSVGLVVPQVWKRRLNLIGQDKNAAREMAMSLYPEAADKLKRVKDDGRAEALLIATYGALALSSDVRSPPCMQLVH